MRHIGWAELEVPARQAIELSVPSSVFRRLVRVGDLDDVQRLIQAFGVLSPLRSIQGEDRADGRVGDSGHVCIPRVKPGPGDDGGQSGSLLGALQRRDLGVAEQLKAVQELVGLVTADIERRRRDRQHRDNHGLARTIKPLDERHDLGIPASHGHDDTDIEDVRCGDRSTVLAHRPGSTAALA